MGDEAVMGRQTPEGQETILVVDDEPSNVILTKEILEGFGYRVLTADNGQEAITVYFAHGKEINLVILDLVMPGIGGGKTFDALRAINPSAKVLLSSGYNADGEAKKILNRGCSGFIQKPFRIAELSKSVKDILGK